MNGLLGSLRCKGASRSGVNNGLRMPYPEVYQLPGQSALAATVRLDEWSQEGIRYPEHFQFGSSAEV